MLYFVVIELKILVIKEVFCFLFICLKLKCVVCLVVLLIVEFVCVVGVWLLFMIVL